MFVMLDIDLPPANGNTTRRVLLHALNTGFKATQRKINGTATLLSSSTQGPATYIPPNPPASDPVPHRYVQLLFRQPANLDVRTLDFSGPMARLNFDITRFMSEHGLAAPLAGNFFRVDGRAGGTATESGGSVRSTMQTFEGMGRRTECGSWLAGLLSILVVFNT